VKDGDSFRIETNKSTYYAKAVVAATGTFGHPIILPVTGLPCFKGTVLHSAQYEGPEKFSGQRVAIVGEGNSGAQILAEVSLVANTFWLTRKEPRFLPDHVDGRYLFDAATQMYEAKKQGKEFQPPSLGDVVMVPSVVNARERGVLKSVGSLASIREHSIILANGKKIEVDALIFCTGFQPALSYLANLGIVQIDGKVKTTETKAVDVPGLWLVGFGNWTGFAAATLIGVGRSAKSTVEGIELYLNKA
jgi:cation diffusion facilitator CzcD-associated flavoprotein CzcO